MNIDRILVRNQIIIEDYERIREEYINNPRIVIREAGSSEPIKKSRKPRECFHDFQEMLFELSRICYNESRIKENLTYVLGNYEDSYPKIHIYGEDSNSYITMGLYRDFFIISEIVYPDNLNLMKDDFWELLAKLKTYGKLGFKEHPEFGKEIKGKYHKLFNKRGNIYKISRNYFLSQIEYGHCNSLGFLRVEWDRDIDFKDIVINYIETFKILYQINFLLWKANGKN